MDIRDKIAQLLYEAEVDNWSKSGIADAILQIPEIKEALDLAKFITKPRAPGNVWQPIIPE